MQRVHREPQRDTGIPARPADPRPMEAQGASPVQNPTSLHKATALGRQTPERDSKRAASHLPCGPHTLNTP